MNGELLRMVDSIHRDKNIDSEVVFSGIESAILTAAKKRFGELDEIVVLIDRETGAVTATHDGEPIDTEFLGRIAAQSAKQVMIQKIREAERDALFDEFVQEKGAIYTGAVQRAEGGIVTINLGKVEALLPRSEQMPGESFRPGERVRAVLLDVRKSGQRVKIILSRTHPDFVRRLFEQEIPEIAEHIIEIRSISREAGYRTKVAVSSIDSKVDCVGACVGVRGSRIKNILDELGGERIDIVRYNESLQVMIPNALAPAAIEEVQIYPRMGRAIVLVREDQLSLAIGKRGQNVRLASKLVSMDIEIMTFDELTEEIDKAEQNFSTIPNITDEMVDSLIQEGILSFDDLSVTEPEQIMEIMEADEDFAMQVIDYAEQQAEMAPAETSSRSAMISNPVPGSGAPGAPISRGGSSEPDRPRVPSVADIFGDIGPDDHAKPEPKISAAQLFGDLSDDAPPSSAPPANPFGDDEEVEGSAEAADGEDSESELSSDEEAVSESVSEASDEERSDS